MAEDNMDLTDESPGGTFAPMPNPTHHTDLLFAGSGLAGFTLAMECAQRPFLRNKKICLLYTSDAADE